MAVPVGPGHDIGGSGFRRRRVGESGSRLIEQSPGEQGFVLKICVIDQRIDGGVMNEISSMVSSLK